MAGQEVLNQDEIDALLNGVDQGAVSTEPAAPPGEARQYDFSREMRIVRGRMPTLEMVNERLARQLRVSIYNLLRRTVEIAVGQVTMKKFSEYTHSLSLPVNLNLVKINPLRGTALFVIDPKLVFAMVDNFFGGVGRQAKIEGREFTATEMRVVHMFLRSAFADMKEAWTPIAKIDVEYVNSEINPNFAGIVTPSEVVVVCPFQIDLDGGGGSLHVVMPYSMIEPLREVLDSGVQSDRAEQDDRWLNDAQGRPAGRGSGTDHAARQRQRVAVDAHGSQARRRAALRFHRQGHRARRRRAAVQRRVWRLARPAVRPLRTEIPAPRRTEQLEELKS